MESRPRDFMKAANPSAARLTTARFILDGPGPSGPRKPAVPNSKNPLKQDCRNSRSFLATASRKVCAVAGSGSSAIHFSTSASKVTLKPFQSIVQVMSPYELPKLFQRPLLHHDLISLL